MIQPAINLDELTVDIAEPDDETELDPIGLARKENTVRVALIRRAISKGDETLVTTTLKEVKDRSRREILVHTTPEQSRLHFYILEETIVRMGQEQAPFPYVPPELDEVQKKTFLQLAILAASLLTTWTAACRQATFSELPGALDVAELENITAVSEKQPLFSNDPFVLDEQSQKFRYRIVIYERFRRWFQKGSSFGLNISKNAIGSMPKIKGPYALSVELAMQGLSTDLEAKVHTLCRRPSLARHAEWLIEPLCRAVGSVPSGEQTCPAEVWFGASVWSVVLPRRAEMKMRRNRHMLVR